MELVSPGGNIEKLRYAYKYGADAVYIGLKNFSLRMKADNFHGTEYEHIQAIKKEYPQKKLFCALNITFHNYEIDELLNNIDYFKLFPFDAFIVQDIGVVPIIQKYFSNAKIHLSTQANCINREAVKMYQKMGFSRVVLGREASLQEISEIKQAVPEMELEVFAHGAMCIAYSGRCLISAYMNGRSANSGACSHSCRWDYKVHEISNQDIIDDILPSELTKRSLQQEERYIFVEEKKRSGEFFPVEEAEKYTALFSSKDLCMIDNLNDLKNAGADSLKIEGRMKSLYYVAVTTGAYRKAIDALEGKISQKEANAFIAELYNTRHREFGTGFFYGRDDANKTTSGESLGNYEMVGLIGREAMQQERDNLFVLAEETIKKHNASLENLHPEARRAKEADFKENPHKVPQCIAPRNGFKLYYFNALNKVDLPNELECVAPDTLGIILKKEDSFFIDLETGCLKTWFSHGQTCFLYTNILLEKEWIVRQKK